MPNNTSLFYEFSSISAKEWKQQIQVDLKGADYNEALVWESLEGIKVKPFYHPENAEYLSIPTHTNDFEICQIIFIDDASVANKIALDALKKGATAIQFIATQSFDMDVLFQGFSDLNKLRKIYFYNHFLSAHFNDQLLAYFEKNTVVIQQDIIGNFAQNGHWFDDSKSDHDAIAKTLKNNPTKTSIGVDTSGYQNAGANITQQVAFALAHANEYLNYFGKDAAQAIQFEFAVGSNYFFEIAKLRAFRYLWQKVTSAHKIEASAKILVKPSQRNKTLYDYNVNLLRTTTENMSGILGGADCIAVMGYDEIFKKNNHFSQRIARNQLLLLSEESGFIKAQHFAKGSYYIEALTIAIANKALRIFQQIEENGGFVTALKNGSIQARITETANKEQALFDSGKLILLGTNKYPNKDDKMKDELELFPFVKKKKKQTLIQPIIPKRLAENLEQERLADE